jgi:hypothetical protein
MGHKSHARARDAFHQAAQLVIVDEEKESCGESLVCYEAEKCDYQEGWQAL